MSNSVTANTSTSAPKSPPKKPKPIDIFLALSSQDLVNLFNQKTVTLTKDGVSFAFTLGEFDSDDVTRLEAAGEALEDIVNDLIDDGDDDPDSEDSDASEFDDDTDDDLEEDETKEVPGVEDE